MRLKIVALLSLLFLFLPLTLHAQYPTSYAWGVTDLTAKATTNSLWWQFPSGICNNISIGYDGYVACTTNGTPTPGPNSAIDYYSTQTHAWVNIAALGTGWMGIAVRAENDLYLLKTASGCTTGGYGIFHWDGTNLTQISGCLAQIAVGQDGALAGVNTLNDVFMLPPGGSWQQLATTSGWVQASAANSSLACAVKNQQVYLWANDGSMQPATTQPYGSALSCFISFDQNIGGPVMYALSTYQSGRPLQTYYDISSYDFSNNTWTAVMTPPGAGPFPISSTSKWMTVALDSAGHIYHFNVYGVYLAGTTTGSVNGCPPPQPCNGNTIHHDVTLRVQLPSGLYGAVAQGSFAPTQNANVIAYDATATGCDAFFGDPTQCPATPTGSVICSASGANLGTPGPVPQPHYAEDVESYPTSGGSWTLTSVNSYIIGPYKGYLAVGRCTATDNACYPGTSTACRPPLTDSTVGVDGASLGTAPSVAQAINAATLECQTTLKAHGEAFQIFYNYTAGSPATCDRVTVYKGKAYQPCY